jgi:hypothetical protein
MQFPQLPEDRLSATRELQAETDVLGKILGFRLNPRQPESESEKSIVMPFQQDRERVAVTIAGCPGEILVSELAALMKQDSETAGFRDEALALIEDWRAAMPAEVAEAFDPAELDAMIAEGLDAVVARLTIEGEPS